MKDVFPALERRFKGNRRLTRLLRKMYEGHGGEPNAKSTLPYVEVTCTGENHDLDTFDTDEPLYSLTFKLYTKQSRSRDAKDAVAELRETFRNADLSSDAFTTVIMRCTDIRHPVLRDGKYEAELDFTLHVSRKTKSPVQLLRAG